MENESQWPDALVNRDGEQTAFIEERERHLHGVEKGEGPLEISGDQRNAAKAFLKKVPLKIKIIGLAIAAGVAVLVFGVILPLALDGDETQYVASATLKRAEDIGNLEVVDYTYTGIAEKKSQLLWAENVDYRVKYEAHVRASYDMSAIEFDVDNENKVVRVSLPDVEISEPVLDEAKFSYLPENVTADVRDVLTLCKEDVANELDSEGLRTEALESVRETVEALTSPLLDEAWTFDFLGASAAKEQSDQEGVRNGEE